MHSAQGLIPETNTEAVAGLPVISRSAEVLQPARIKQQNDAGSCTRAVHLLASIYFSQCPKVVLPYSGRTLLPLRVEGAHECRPYSHRLS
jgi:hypothetical protein